MRSQRKTLRSRQIILFDGRRKSTTAFERSCTAQPTRARVSLSSRGGGGRSRWSVLSNRTPSPGSLAYVAHRESARVGLGRNYRCRFRHRAACRSCRLDGSPNRAGIHGKRDSLCGKSVARRLGRQSTSHYRCQICWWTHGHRRRLGVRPRGSNRSDRRRRRLLPG